MFHAKTPYGRAVVVSDLLFLGVEAYALADDCGWTAMITPYGEGKFEADSEDALGDLVRAFAEWM
jgi:hypothetical protein